MQYLITFLEGIISFISPCMLPLLPVYVSYFSGGADKKTKVLPRAISFVLGFTTVFCLLGVFAGTLGAALVKFRTPVNIVCGLIVIVLGLNFLDIIKIPFFRSSHAEHHGSGTFSAFVFGVVFSVSHTPCVGAFLGSALMLASTSGTVVKGVLLLLIYSLGMGIPFLVSAVLLNKLTAVFDAIKKNYRIINIVCGIFLIVVGIAMMFGLMESIHTLFE